MLSPARGWKPQHLHQSRYQGKGSSSTPFRDQELLGPKNLPKPLRAGIARRIGRRTASPPIKVILSHWLRRRQCERMTNLGVQRATCPLAGGLEDGVLQRESPALPIHLFPQPRRGQQRLKMRRLRIGVQPLHVDVAESRLLQPNTQIRLVEPKPMIPKLLPRLIEVMLA